MYATPDNHFKIPEQSLLTLETTFTGPRLRTRELTEAHRPKRLLLGDFRFRFSLSVSYCWIHCFPSALTFVDFFSKQSFYLQTSTCSFTWTTPAMREKPIRAHSLVRFLGFWCNGICYPRRWTGDCLRYKIQKVIGFAATLSHQDEGWCTWRQWRNETGTQQAQYFGCQVQGVQKYFSAMSTATYPQVDPGVLTKRRSFKQF